MASLDTAEPQAVFRDDAGTLAVVLAGSWSADRAPRIEALVEEIGERVAKASRATARPLGRGAARYARRLCAQPPEGPARGGGGRRRDRQQAARARRAAGRGRHPRLRRAAAAEHFGVVNVLVNIGKAVVRFGRDMVGGAMFLGEVVVGSAGVVLGPRKFRGPSLVNQIELIAFNGAPIIMLISFLVGCIVAQQGIFQLQQFGATVFVVNLIGILILRELGRAADLDHDRRPLRLGLHRRDRLDEDARGDRRAARHGARSDRGPGRAAHPGADHLAADPDLHLRRWRACSAAALVAWLYGGIGIDTFLARLQSVDHLEALRSSA